MLAHRSRVFFMRWPCADAFFNLRRFVMVDYEKLYHEMFNKVTDVIEELKELQKKMEEEYLKQTDNEEH